MDYLSRFHSGRRDMVDAFVELTALARQAGVDPDATTATHGKFFDGNVAVKESFWLAVVLPQLCINAPTRPCQCYRDARAAGS